MRWEGSGALGGVCDSEGVPQPTPRRLARAGDAKPVADQICRTCADARAALQPPPPPPHCRRKAT
eukprot:365915-Chlamydomonas_euryale.AAC.1